MNKFFFTVIFFFAAILSLSAGEIKHRFICVDNGYNQLIHIDETGINPNWVVPIPDGSRDLLLVNSDEILVSHRGGAHLYSIKDGTLVESYDDLFKYPRHYIETVIKSNDGGYLVGSNRRNGKVEIFWVNSDWTNKKLMSKIVKPMTGRFSGDPGLRLMRKNSKGQLLITQIITIPSKGTQYFVAAVKPEFSAKVEWQALLPGKGYAAMEQPDGTVVVSTGGAISIVFINSDGETIRTLGGDQFAGQGVSWFSGFDMSPEGTVVVANWLGHGHEGDGPHLLEFSLENELLWSWADHQLADRVTNVILLD